MTPALVPKKRRPKGFGGAKLGNDGRWRGYKTIDGIRRYTPWVSSEALALDLIPGLRAPVAEVVKTTRTLREAIAGWMDEAGHAGTTRGNNEQKIAGYLSELLDEDVETITREQLTKFYRSMARSRGLATSTIRQTAQIVRGGLGYAHDNGWLVANVAIAIKLPVGRAAESEGFSEEDREAVLAGIAGIRHEARWRTALLYGLRPGEATGLRWSSVNFDEGYIAVSGQIQRLKVQVDGVPLGTIYRGTAKSESGVRRIWLDRTSLDLLTAWKTEQETEADSHTETAYQIGRRADQIKRLARAKKLHLLENPGLYSVAPKDLVFTLKNGEPILPRKDADEWAALLAAAGVAHTRMYTMRHTSVHHALLGGAPITAVSVMAGHGSTAFTERVYGGNRDELGRDVSSFIVTA